MREPKPMTMKAIRAALSKQGLVVNRNWATDFLNIFDRAGKVVAQGPRHEIQERIRSGESFAP